MCHGLPAEQIGDGFFSDDIPESESEMKAEKTTLASLAKKAGFSWRLAEITDRHKKLENVDVVGRLAAIHRKYDPDGSKAVARLLKSFNENS